MQQVIRQSLCYESSLPQIKCVESHASGSHRVVLVRNIRPGFEWKVSVFELFVGVARGIGVAVQSAGIKRHTRRYPVGVIVVAFIKARIKRGGYLIWTGRKPARPYDIRLRDRHVSPDVLRAHFGRSVFL
jgi:hypothetical protein